MCHFSLELVFPEVSSCALSFHMEDSVKLRDDWRNRSRPITPGGVYPAKDHCRYLFVTEKINSHVLITS